MRDECRHYFEDEDRFKCMKGHACYCRFGEPCKNFQTLEEWRAEQKKKENNK